MGEGSERYASHPGRGGFSREQLIDQLQTVWREQGVLPTTRDCDAGNWGLASNKAFMRAFGSLKEGLVAAGITSSAGGEGKSRVPTRGHL